MAKPRLFRNPPVPRLVARRHPGGGAGGPRHGAIVQRFDYRIIYHGLECNGNPAALPRTFSNFENLLIIINRFAIVTMFVVYNDRLKAFDR